MTARRLRATWPRSGAGSRRPPPCAPRDRAWCPVRADCRARTAGRAAIQPSTNVVVDALVHVDALDAAARLAGVEVRAVDEVLDRVRDVGVVPHVRRIAAAELEPRADEARRGCPLHGVTARDRAREGDEVDARIADRRAPCPRDSCAAPGSTPSGRPASRKQSANRSAHSGVCAECLSTTALPGEHRRHDAVDGDQVRVVPRRDRQHDAERLAAHEAREVGLRSRVDVGERVRRRSRSCDAHARACRALRSARNGSAGPSASVSSSAIASRRSSNARRNASAAPLRRASGTERQARCASRAAASAASTSSGPASGRSA